MAIRKKKMFNQPLKKKKATKKKTLKKSSLMHKNKKDSTVGTAGELLEITINSKKKVDVDVPLRNLQNGAFFWLRGEQGMEDRVLIKTDSRKDGEIICTNLWTGCTEFLYPNEEVVSAERPRLYVDDPTQT